MDGEYNRSYLNLNNPLTSVNQAPELLLAEDEEEETEVQSVAVRSKRTDVYALGMVCRLNAFTLAYTLIWLMVDYAGKATCSNLSA